MSRNTMRFIVREVENDLPTEREREKRKRRRRE